MKVLVANIGSTSFKFRLFDLSNGAERELGSGGVDRIGGTGGVMSFAMGSTGVPSLRDEMPVLQIRDHGQAIAACLAALVESGVLANAADLDAVAFKAVLAGDAPPVAFVDDKLLAAMEYYAPAAPAHNPAYVVAMRSFRTALGPKMPLVAAFEPGFHRTIPARRWLYACPAEWTQKYGIRRLGYHGASHRYVSKKVAELMGAGRARRIITCHLGGSSSICAVRDGQSVATSMGFSPQSGLPQSGRVGDFDPYALAVVARETGKSLGEMLAELGQRGGLAAMSGTSGDVRDIYAAIAAGSEKAKLALDAFVTSIRDFIGAFLVELGGADALAFTGGIGENNPPLRAAICENLDFAGIRLDPAKNTNTKCEARIDASGESCAIWVLPTNEELVVARQARELLLEGDRKWVS
jgi:acetate kinase